MSIPVSSTTCERTFRKMKLIKTTARDTMSDIRLNLCVLAAELDLNIDFEKLTDDFANSHKNRRISLKLIYDI
jgi:hAT family protein